MADWLDRRLGQFCEDISKQIEDNRFLSPPMKEKYLKMLEECASKAQISQEDTIAFMKREMPEYARQYRLETGGLLRIS